MAHKYKLRYFFEFGAGPLWAINDAARRDFSIAYISPESLPLSEETQRRAGELAAWYDQSLNQEYPPDPSPWRQDECDRFNNASKQLFAIICTELGEDYNLVDQQQVLSEDPELERYLKDPKGFRRSQSTR